MTVVKSLTFGTGTSTVVERCQVCDQGGLEPVVFLGYLPPVNAMPPEGTPLQEQPSYPAQLLRCPQCELVQLGLIVDPQVLFPPDYPYTSGTTRLLRENFVDLARECERLVPGGAQDLVVDIGSNDGTLLSQFAGSRRVLGVEPTDAGRLATAQGIATVQAFFAHDLVADLTARHGRARLVTAANVLAHVEDVHDVLRGVRALLDPQGVFVSESHDFNALVDRLQYDTVYHEHLRYYTLRSLDFLLSQHGLRIFHARRIPTHGGSLRVFAARTGSYPVQESVGRLFAEEAAAAKDADRLPSFRRRIAESKLALASRLQELSAAGGRVVGIGAPSRATTLIHYAGLDTGLLECVYEIAGSRKIGRYIPGTLIPVREEAGLFQDPPTHALLLSWHLADELIPKIAAKGYRGRFLVPLPAPRIVEPRA
jgi:hypothetical protein